MAVSMLLMTACDKEKDEKSPVQITVTAQRTDMSIRLAGSGEVTIDWGDGTKSETHTLLDAPYINDFRIDNTFRYSHAYSGTSSRKITVSGGTVTHFLCDSSNVTKLDVSRSPDLIYLSCRQNELTSLEISKKSEFAVLVCNFNRLTHLDVSQNPKLEYLACNNNQLTKLDISNSFAMYLVDCRNNNLTVESLNYLFETLHNHILSWTSKQIIITANPGTNNCDKRIVENKGWLVFTN